MRGLAPSGPGFVQDGRRGQLPALKLGIGSGGMGGMGSIAGGINRNSPSGRGYVSMDLDGRAEDDRIRAEEESRRSRLAQSRDKPMSFDKYAKKTAKGSKKNKGFVPVPAKKTRGVPCAAAMKSEWP